MGRILPRSDLCTIGLLIGLLGWPATLGSAGLKRGAEPSPAARLLSVRLLPEEVRLRGKGAAQQLLVIGTYADGLERDLTEGSRFTLADPALAEIDARGRVRARSDGSTLLTIQSSGQVLQAAVQVRDSAISRPLRFDSRNRQDSHQAGLQQHRVPRQRHRAGRVQALQERRRSPGGLQMDRGGRRLPRPHGRDRREGAPDPLGGSRSEPVAAQGQPGGAPRGRPTAPERLPRLWAHPGLGRRGRGLRVQEWLSIHGAGAGGGHARSGGAAEGRGEATAGHRPLG